MCYSLFLSTDSREDLTCYNSDLVKFQHPNPDERKYLSILKHSEKWCVGSKSGCSCTFRHLLSVELGFGEPIDWYAEEEDELRATAELYRVIAKLLSQGNQVDCLDIWMGTGANDWDQAVDIKAIPEKIVDLHDVSEQAFRFFENYHFVFK